MLQSEAATQLIHVRLLAHLGCAGRVSSDRSWCGVRMGGNDVYELVLLDQAGQALAEAQSFEQIKDIRDKAEAVRKYAQSASLGLGIQNRAAEVKLRAERQAGKLLSQMMLRGGDRRSKIHQERLKLDDLGISRNQSTRWQMQARVPENVFREHIRETCAAGKELTSARLMRLAKHWGESAHSNGINEHTRGENGRRTRRSGKSAARSQNTEGSSSADPAAEILSELADHHQLLDNILRPIYSGESTTLLAAERRVVRYLLIETRQLLVRLEKLNGNALGCACHSDRARF